MLRAKEVELQDKGFVRHEAGRCIQNGDNCFEIAAFLAKKFGFQPPASGKELIDLILGCRGDEYFGTSNVRHANSSGYFVIRSQQGETDDIHVTFEYGGIEYNFGPAEDHGFTIERRIPLPIKTN